MPRRLRERADGADLERHLRRPDAESFDKVLDGFANGNPVKPGPQIDRQFSAPVGGATTLKTVKA